MTAALDRLVARGVVRHGSVSGRRSGRRAVRARRRARRDPAPAGARPTPAREPWPRPSSSRRSCCGVTTCTPSIASSARPACWPRSSCCRATTCRCGSGSTTCCPRASRTIDASGSIASVSAARSCGRCSSRRPASGLGAGASGWRCATTSAGCARAPSAPRWTRGPRTCSCICSCAAPRSRVIWPGRPVSIRPRRWPRYGSCSGPVWRPPTRSAPSWLPARRHGRANDRAAARRRPRRGQARGVLAHLPPVGRWSAIAEDEPLSPEERDEARANLLLARYGVVARELARGDWATLAPHAAPHGVRRRRRARLLRRGSLRRAVRPAGRAHRSGRAAHAPGRASRAGESRRPGESLGPRVAAGASRTARA